MHLHIFTIAMCLAICNGHIILKTPKPFKFAAYGPSNPLLPDGSDFPCKIPPGINKLEIDGSPTTMTVGEEQRASFTGLAVHGGGPCQFALTPGFTPNASSEWAVIKSIEGGCPAINQKGNLEDGQEPDTYSFIIPDAFDPGVYTFAWAWVNRIGGAPEFYMNCAPIVVKAGTPSRKSRVEGRRALGKHLNFPGLFMANIGEVGDQCLTTEANKQQQAIAYPFPGHLVDHPEGAANLLPQPCDGNQQNGVISPDQAPNSSVLKTTDQLSNTTPISKSSKKSSKLSPPAPVESGPVTAKALPGPVSPSLKMSKKVFLTTEIVIVTVTLTPPTQANIVTMDYASRTSLNRETTTTICQLKPQVNWSP